MIGRRVLRGRLLPGIPAGGHGEPQRARTQVYRAKVRILEQAERLKPGTEGNVYLVRDGTPPEKRAER